MSRIFLFLLVTANTLHISLRCHSLWCCFLLVGTLCTQLENNKHALNTCECDFAAWNTFFFWMGLLGPLVRSWVKSYTKYFFPNRSLRICIFSCLLLASTHDKQFATFFLFGVWVEVNCLDSGYSILEFIDIESSTLFFSMTLPINCWDQHVTLMRFTSQLRLKTLRSISIFHNCIYKTVIANWTKTPPLLIILARNNNILLPFCLYLFDKVRLKNNSFYLQHVLRQMFISI